MDSFASNRNLKALRTSLVPILKLCSLIVGFVVIQVGWYANYNSSFYKRTFENPVQRKKCSTDDMCPSSTLYLDAGFEFFTILCFLVSIASLVAGFILVFDKNWDMIVHFCAAGLLFVAGILMIISVVKIDNSDEIFYCPPQLREKLLCKLDLDKLSQTQRTDYYNDRETWRNTEKFTDKIVAGTFCFINALLYALIATVILLSNPSGEGQVNASTNVWKAQMRDVSQVVPIVVKKPVESEDLSQYFEVETPLTSAIVSLADTSGIEDFSSASTYQPRLSKTKHHHHHDHKGKHEHHHNHKGKKS